MVLRIPITADTEARLRRQAEAAGKDVTAYVSQLVEQAAAKPAIDQMLSPLREQFAQSGTSEEQLIDEITAAQSTYRAEKRKRPA